MLSQNHLLTFGDIMNITEFWVFLLAAIALLGSPGPAIAAILAVGRTEGWARGLGFYGGLQIGLAAAAGISITSLFTAISLLPAATLILTIAATTYLLYLAYKIASSPVGQEASKVSTSSSPIAGLFLGITNPKAYVAFASLFASFQIFSSNSSLDSLSKWITVVIVMIVVDFIWLWIGVRLGQLSLSHKSERFLNYFLAFTILAAAIVAIL